MASLHYLLGYKPIHLRVLRLKLIVYTPLLRNMASNDRTAAHGTASDNQKEGITGGDHVERVETLDNDIALAKVEADAKLDEFGARSKTNPAEIALVKKLDRTILVSPQKYQ